MPPAQTRSLSSEGRCEMPKLKSLGAVFFSWFVRGFGLGMYMGGCEVSRTDLGLPRYRRVHSNWFQMHQSTNQSIDRSTNTLKRTWPAAAGPASCLARRRLKRAKSAETARSAAAAPPRKGSRILGPVVLLLLNCGLVVD